MQPQRYQFYQHRSNQTPIAQTKLDEALMIYLDYFQVVLSIGSTSSINIHRNSGSSQILHDWERGFYGRKIVP